VQCENQQRHRKNPAAGACQRQYRSNDCAEAGSDHFVFSHVEWGFF
jgi:hypothetical protein